MTKDKARFDIMMSTFANRNGLNNLEKDESDQYRLTIDGCDINCFLHAGRIYLECDFDVNVVHRLNQDIPLENMLQQTLVSLDERRESLSIDPEGLLCLWRSIDIRELNVIDLEQALTEFVESAEFYSRYLQPSQSRPIGLRL